jgi:hypothetical protein
MKYNASEQTIGWFKDRYLEETLEIRPPYQRRPVWTVRQKSNLIESILLGLPVPEIYIHSTTSDEGETEYAVVDGQQRVRAILQFLGLDRDENEQDSNGFSLEELREESRWKGLTFADLTVDEKKKFYGHKLAVRFLEDSTEPEVRDLFRRLNTYLTKLNDQELRNATYSGPLVDLVNKLANDDYWAENGIVSAAMIRRMKDMEFVSELIIGTLDGPQGGAGKIIDDYYLELEPYSEAFPKQNLVERRYNRTLSLIKEMFPDMRGTRWKNRSDFYSLFVALAQLLRTKTVSQGKVGALKKSLSDFAKEVDAGIEGEERNVSEAAATYIDAVLRGSSDRSRRAVRHASVTGVIEKHFHAKKLVTNKLAKGN